VTMQPVIRVAALTLVLVAAVVGLCVMFAGYLRPEAIVDFANRMFLC
jgi:hypothetical protein